jgi:hypothetical protein
MTSCEDFKIPGHNSKGVGTLLIGKLIKVRGQSRKQVESGRQDLNICSHPKRTQYTLASRLKQ